MKHLIKLLFALACLLCVSQTFAQMAVHIQPIRTEFLVGEPVAIKITFTNHTDRAITLRNTPELRWLNFQVSRSGQSYPVNGKSTPKFPALTLGPGERRSYEVNIYPYYDLGKEGRYSVTATVVVPDGHATYTSNRTTFTLSQGGVVKSFDIQARGKKLKVALKMLTVGGSPCLFGQVTSTGDNQVLGACFMGKYLSFMQPCVKLDSAMNLHVLCQSTPEYFTYSIMNTHGERASMKFYRRSGGPVDLITTGGGLRVMGLAPYTKKMQEDDSIHDASDRPH